MPIITLKCPICRKDFLRTPSHYNNNNKNRQGNHFCSKECFQVFIQQTRRIATNCTNCCIPITKRKSDKAKAKNFFCSMSCAATYNNKHKTKGTRRSKLEVYLETELKSLFPDLELLFNNKQAINSELDIYIPKLSIAFELNGIVHYEPIYGVHKLSKIQSNDDRKFQACLDCGISLVILDTSAQKRVTVKSSKIYLDKITEIIYSLTSEEGSRTL